MSGIAFLWDDNKTRQNQKKHRVSFEEASTVFLDENAIEFFDPDHSKSEDRFLMLGLSYRLRLIVVSYAVKQKGNQIRIISARRATKGESRAYRRR